MLTSKKIIGNDGSCLYIFWPSSNSLVLVSTAYYSDAELELRLIRFITPNSFVEASWTTEARLLS